MTSAQVWALGIFGAVVLLLSIGMWPASRMLNGAQKYRRLRRPGPDVDPEANSHASMSPMAVVLAFFAGSAASDQADASSDFDGGSAEGGDAGGGGGGE